MVDMRILILNWRDLKNPSAGGAELAVDNIARELHKNGHKITIFTSAFDGCKKEENLGYARIVREGSMHTVYLRASSYYRRHKDEFDAIIESVSAVPFFTPLYAKNKKLVIIPHHLVRDVIFKERGTIKGAPAYLAESIIPSVYKTTNFVVPSKYVKSEFVKFGVKSDNITVSYFNAVHPDFKPAKLKKTKKPTLITVTRLMKYKRVDMLLEILKDIREKIDVDMIVIGSGKERNNLKEQAKRLGIEKNVKFTGHIKEEQKAELLAKSWVFVTASEREGFGISALEAEMCGTPVVAFDNGGLKEAIKHNYSGFIIKGADKKAFENAIISLLTNGKLRNKLSANSITYGNSFNTKKEIRKIERIISR